MNDLEEIAVPVVLPRNTVNIIRGGKAYFDLLLRMIGQARESIYLQTYIYDDDETGKLVGDALKAAAARHVAVYLMADGYASQVMSQHFIDQLREAGVHFRFFDPLLKSKYFYFGRRLHHKVLVTDARCCLVGGVNISDRYNDMPGKPAWLDFALYAEGPISRELQTLCSKTWNGFNAVKGYENVKTNTGNETLQPNLPVVKMRRNDWVRRKNEVFETYLRMLGSARSHIYIVCSYFLPGKTIRQHLQRAASRGVKVKIITAGRSDVMLTKFAERWLYDWLLRNNIELYEYQPTVLHAKLAVCDSKWLTIGSYNINDLSTYASIELNLDVHHAVIAKQAEQIFSSILKDSVLITVKSHARSNNMLKQLGRWFSYQFIRVTFHLLTFYYKQKG